MMRYSIFETERLLVRNLKITDLNAFHDLQGNSNVMRFVSRKVGGFEENKKELQRLIEMDKKKENDFNIFGIELKVDQKLIGTVALVQTEENEDEIGYRFIEKYWNKGFGKEIVPALINYCKEIGLKSIVAFVSYNNTASLKIIEKNKFNYVEDFYAKDLEEFERKYMLKL